MSVQHPITPPPELVQQLLARFHTGDTLEATWAIAYRAGADQELEACCAEVLWQEGKALAKKIRARRRPKPPSLKEQALLQLDTLNADLAMHGRGCDLSQIRRALEALDD
jgi:hypothetical protein